VVQVMGWKIRPIHYEPFKESGTAQSSLEKGVIKDNIIH
jgi:hypothetical protein